MSNVNRPGIRAIIDRLAHETEGTLTPEELVDRCLDIVGPLTVSDSTRDALVTYATRQGDLDLTARQPGDESEQRVGNMLRLVASTREFQLA